MFFFTPWNVGVRFFSSIFNLFLNTPEYRQFYNINMLVLGIIFGLCIPRGAGSGNFHSHREGEGGQVFSCHGLKFSQLCPCQY